MSYQAIQPPAAAEFNPFYATYIDPVAKENVLEGLEWQARSTAQLLAGISETQAAHRYAPGKWSLKEVIGHVTDAERIFAYRALRIARGDTTPLAGFDENAYVAAAGFDRRSLTQLAADLASIRVATLGLFGGLTAEELARGGTASGHPVSVRALAFIILGHERHHVNVLKSRYLGARAGA
jgi:DinB family protein